MCPSHVPPVADSGSASNAYRANICLSCRVFLLLLSHFKGSSSRWARKPPSSPSLCIIYSSFSLFLCKMTSSTPNVSETDWWDYNNVDSYMHNGQLTVTGVRKAQCWWRRGATTGLIIGCTNMTSDPRATALVWRMMAVTNLGGIGGECETQPLERGSQESVCR